MAPRNNIVILPRREDTAEIERIFRDIITAWKNGELSYFQYSAVIGDQVKHQTLRGDTLNGI